MFCFYTSSKLYLQKFEFSLKVKVMGLNPSYLLKSFLLYRSGLFWIENWPSLEKQPLLDSKVSATTALKWKLFSYFKGDYSQSSTQCTHTALELSKSLLASSTSALPSFGVWSKLYIPSDIKSILIEGEQKKGYYRFLGWKQYLWPECFKALK